jgi:alpha-galactosidase
MHSLKIACLGGGGLYFKQALLDLILEKKLGGSEIVLYDLNKWKAERMAKLGRRLVEAAGAKMTVRAAAKLSDALKGASFVVSAIGGSGAEITRNVYDSYYHNADMHISAKYGIHQVIGDTCGPAGMMMGLRSIPAYMNICREMEKLCPDAILFNHSNPMACIMRAIHKYSPINAIGLCHGVNEGILFAAQALGVNPLDLQCVWIGTNHYYWFTRVLHKGKDVMQELMRAMRKKEGNPDHAMTAALSNAYGYRLVYSDDGHAIEFYPFATQAARMDCLITLPNPPENMATILRLPCRRLKSFLMTRLITL